MILRLDSYLGDYAWDDNVGNYIWTQTVEFKNHAFWIIWYKYEELDSYPYMIPYFLSLVFPDIHSFIDLEELGGLQYVATDDMVIISKKE